MIRMFAPARGYPSAWSQRGLAAVRRSWPFFLGDPLSISGQQCVRKSESRLRFHKICALVKVRTMSRVQRIERLIANASRRLELAQHEVLKIKSELRELNQKLAEAKLEEQQFLLPFEPRTRGPSEKWAAVLNFMLLRSPNAVSIDELLEFASQNQLNISRSSARAQLHHYEQRGIVERIGDGLFLPTDAAKAFCDY